ncbi:MAG: OsmC family protein [Bacteroidetes bacterium]|nr:OsmC family protein [Bacteroidota bacterium]
MDDIFYYETKVTWKEGKIGELSSDGMDNITIATPPEFPGGVPNVWSPEHLFAASANICLMTTFLAIAENSKLNFISFSSKGKGKVEKVDGKLFVTQIELSPNIIVNNEHEKERALRIIEKSEKACLISRSMKSEIILKPEIIVQN